jgi:small-conductance mechanosensitive channel
MIMTLQEFMALLKDYDILGAIVIIIAAIVIGEIVKLIIRRVGKSIAKRTKTSLDDELIHATETPVLWAIIIVGIFVAALSVTHLALYRDYILKAASLVGILWGAWLVLRIISALLRWYGTEISGRTATDLDDKYMHIFKRVFNIAVLVLTGMLILGQLGVSITPLIASLGIAGLAVGLALQDTLANFFSGFWIISERAVKIGDYVEIEGSSVKGIVEDINWRTSRIRTLSNNMNIIPNAKFAQSTVINYQAPTPQMSISIPVSCSYDSDLEKVEAVCIEVGKEIVNTTPGGVKDSEPAVRYQKYGESSIDFVVWLKIEDPQEQYRVRHEFIKKLKKRFVKEKIEIPFPQRVIHMKK